MQKVNVTFKTHPDNVAKWKKEAKINKKSLSSYVDEIVNDKKLSVYSRKTWKDFVDAYRKLREPEAGSSVVNKFLFILMGLEQGEIKVKKNNEIKMIFSKKELEDIHTFLQKAFSLIIEPDLED